MVGFCMGFSGQQATFAPRALKQVWWFGDVFAESGEHGTDEGNPNAVLCDSESNLCFASHPRFLVSPELAPEEDRWRQSHEAQDSNGPIGQIRVRLSVNLSLKVQICAGGDWDEIRDFHRQLPKIGCPLQILRLDGLDGSDCCWAMFRNFSVGVPPFLHPLCLVVANVLLTLESCSYFIITNII